MRLLLPTALLSLIAFAYANLTCPGNGVKHPSFAICDDGKTNCPEGWSCFMGLACCLDGSAIGVDGGGPEGSQPGLPGQGGPDGPFPGPSPGPGTFGPSPGPAPPIPNQPRPFPGPAPIPGPAGPSFPNPGPAGPSFPNPGPAGPSFPNPGPGPFPPRPIPGPGPSFPNPGPGPSFPNPGPSGPSFPNPGPGPSFPNPGPSGPSFPLPGPSGPSFPNPGPSGPSFPNPGPGPSFPNPGGPSPGPSFPNAGPSFPIPGPGPQPIPAPGPAFPNPGPGPGPNSQPGQVRPQPGTPGAQGPGGVESYGNDDAPLPPPPFKESQDSTLVEISLPVIREVQNETVVDIRPAPPSLLTKSESGSRSSKASAAEEDKNIIVADLEKERASLMRDTEEVVRLLIVRLRQTPTLGFSLKGMTPRQIVDRLREDIDSADSSKERRWGEGTDPAVAGRSGFPDEPRGPASEDFRLQDLKDQPPKPRSSLPKWEGRVEQMKADDLPLRDHPTPLRSSDLLRRTASVTRGPGATAMFVMNMGPASTAPETTSTTSTTTTSTTPLTTSTSTSTTTFSSAATALPPPDAAVTEEWTAIQLPPGVQIQPPKGGTLPPWLLIAPGTGLVGMLSTDDLVYDYDQTPSPDSQLHLILSQVKLGGCPSRLDERRRGGVSFRLNCQSDANCPGRQKCCEDFDRNEALPTNGICKHTVPVPKGFN